MYKGQIPFDPTTGELLQHYNQRWHSSTPVTWKDNYSWVEPLIFSRFERGRSGLWAIFDSPRKVQIYAMPSNKFEEVLKSQKLESGRVVAEWTFYKQGGRYVVGLLDGRSTEEIQEDEDFVKLLNDVRVRKEPKEIGQLLGVPTAKVNRWLLHKELPTKNKWTKDKQVKILQGLL